MSTDSAPRAGAPRRAARRRGRGLLISGVVCLALGLAGLTWSAWDLFWNPLVDPAAAAAEASGLREEWAAPTEATRPLPGEAVALLRVPVFGADFEQPVLAGTDQRTLKRGLGWYDGTAAPGEIGNFSVAGHRGTTGPFSRMHELKAGDEVVVETREAILTYQVTNEPSETTVTDTDTWVIQPVPGRPEAKPTQALLTLTTCNDLFRSPRRMIAFGVLIGTRTK